MSDATKGDDKSQDTQKGQDADKQSGQDQNKAPELTKEQWEAAFKHERFQKLLESDKKLKEVEAQRAKEEEAEKLKKGKFEELITEKDKKLADAETRYKTTVLSYSIEKEAAKLGVVDTEVVSKLIDQSKISYNSEGQPENVAELVKELVESKPYLVNSQQKPPANIGNTPQGQKPAGGGMWAYSELKSKMNNARWTQENYKEVQAAFAEKRVDFSK